MKPHIYSLLFTRTHRTEALDNRDITVIALMICSGNMCLSLHIFYFWYFKLVVLKSLAHIFGTHTLTGTDFKDH